MNQLKSINKNSLEKLKPFLVVTLHLIALVVVFHFLSYWEFFRGIGDFKRWDSGWYEEIAKNGYSFKLIENSSCGFFPLFSYLWAIVPFGTTGIVIVNFILYFWGLLLLQKLFAFDNLFLAVCLSIPSVMFMYVPYTEALFFLTTSVFLYGLIKNDTKLVYIGLFLASCTRPTAVFFIPAIIFMELMHHTSIRTTIINCLKYSATSLAGICVVLIIQYFQTGVWFAYFKAQSISWKREFSIPDIPFTTWDGPRVLWIDGIALMFGTIAFGILLYILFKKWASRKLIDTDKATLFSICYTVMAVLSVVFFNDKDLAGGTSLMGANRYVMATPCFVLFLNYLVTNSMKEKIIILVSIIMGIVCALMLGLGAIIKPYDHAQSNNYVLLIMLYVLSYMLLAGKYRKTYCGALYVINVVAQLHLIAQFSTGLWVG